MRHRLCTHSGRPSVRRRDGAKCRETSAESAILALESGANNVSGREEDSFPVTLQVFFHELSSERTDVDADEPPTGHIWRNVGEEKEEEEESQCKRERGRVLPSHSAAFDGDDFTPVNVCKTLIFFFLK